MKIEAVQRAIIANQIRVTDHADEEMVADQLTLDEVLRTTQAGEIIEDYPTDRPLSSCLILGRDRSGKPIHCVWAYNEVSRLAVLVTVYRVDPQRWVDGRVRVK